jgi:hypothetical protein
MMHFIIVDGHQYINISIFLEEGYNFSIFVYFVYFSSSFWSPVKGFSNSIFINVF